MTATNTAARIEEFIDSEFDYAATQFEHGAQSLPRYQVRHILREIIQGYIDRIPEVALQDYVSVHAGTINDHVIVPSMPELLGIVILDTVVRHELERAFERAVQRHDLFFWDGVR